MEETDKYPILGPRVTAFSIQLEKMSGTEIYFLPELEDRLRCRLAYISLERYMPVFISAIHDVGKCVLLSSSSPTYGKISPESSCETKCPVDSSRKIKELKKRGVFLNSLFGAPPFNRLQDIFSSLL